MAYVKNTLATYLQKLQKNLWKISQDPLNIMLNIKLLTFEKKINQFDKFHCGPKDHKKRSVSGCSIRSQEIFVEKPK